MNGITVFCNGRVVREPEIRTLPNGNTVCSASIAVKDPFRTDESTGYKRTIWLKASIWGRSGEAFGEHVKKGDSVNIMGSLQYDVETGGPNLFVRRDGTQGTSFEVNVDSWEFAGSAQRVEGEQAPVSASAGSFSAAEEVAEDYESDDIAF